VIFKTGASVVIVELCNDERDFVSVAALASVDYRNFFSLANFLRG
jgi:hypothetical protein